MVVIYLVRPWYMVPSWHGLLAYAVYIVRLQRSDVYFKVIVGEVCKNVGRAIGYVACFF